MDLFDKKALSRLYKEEGVNKKFMAESQKLRITSMSDSSTQLEYLLEIKELFQKMLPKMPKKYIMRQAYDYKHCNLVLQDKNDRIIGAVCYRPAFDYNLVEIVFFAIDFEYHTHGYGTFLFNCFKEVCKKQYTLYLEMGDKYLDKNLEISDLSSFGGCQEKAEEENCCYEGGCKPGQEYAFREKEYGSPEREDECPGSKSKNHCGKVYDEMTNLYLLTYADNSAIGFFKKQGFVTQPVSSSWIGYIKDYDGGTLMECKIHSGLNYLKKRELVEKLRNNIFESMEEVNEYHIVRRWDDRIKLGEFYKDEAQTFGEYPSNVSYRSCQRSSRDFLNDFLYFMICTLRSDSYAWPFLEPVNTKDVPDYLDVISKPIDMSVIARKHREGKYSTLKEFVDDIYLMINNCLTYNNVETQYYKCGEKIRESLENLLKKYKEIIKFWGFSY